MANSNTSRVRSQQSGFTVIEVVVTTVIMSVAILIISQMVIMIDAVNRESRNFVIAIEYGQQQMEHYRNAGFNAIPDSIDFAASLPSQLSSPRTGTLTFTDLNPVVAGLKKMLISITYKEGSRTKTITLTSLVAQRGINR